MLGARAETNAIPWVGLTQRGKAMASGTIARIIGDRGFGFIRPDDGGEDVFFHHSSVADGSFDQLTPGQQVEYEMGRDSRSNRTRAENVRTA